MLKLKEGFEVVDDGRDGAFLTPTGPTGGNHREALVFTWHDGKEPLNGRVHAFPHGGGSYCGFGTEQEAHEYLLSVGSESPWEACEESGARRVVGALTRAASEGVIDAPERDYALPPVNEPVDTHAALQLRAAALQKQVDILRKEEFRLTIKNHKASAMIARLKRANNARPESPAYYNQGVDCADIVNAYNLSYWDGGAVCHILRAGNKPGESRLQALENALACLRHSIAVERGVK